MKKIITTVLLMISVFTSVFAESAFERDKAYMESHPEEREAYQKEKAKRLEEFQKEQEEFQKKMDAEELENNKFMLKAEEGYLKMIISKTWELKDIRDAEVTYSFRTVTFKGKKNKVIVNIVLNTVTVNGRAYKFDKDFVICKEAKKAHELNKTINKEER